MQRRSRFLAAVLVLLCAACPEPPAADAGPHPSADAGGGPDGGLRDGGSEDGGAPPGDALPCAAEGIPCAREDVSPEARATAAAVMAEIDAMLEAGAPFGDVLAMVRAHEDVVETGASTGAFYLRVDGGRPRWVLDGDRRADGADVEASGRVTGQAVVEHPDAENTPHHGEHKRALFVDPFRWQMGSEHEALIAKLGETRDYGRAGAVEREAQLAGESGPVGPDAFTGWREYDLVMVTTHGASAVRDDGGPIRRGVLFSSVPCEDEGPVTDHGSTPGLACSRMVLNVEQEDGSKQKTVYKMVSMDQSFFAHTYPNGLRDQIAILDACESSHLGIGVAGAQLGWTDTIKIDSSIETMNAVFELLIDDGLAVIDVMSKLSERGLDAYSQSNGATPRLVSAGGDFLRAREVIHLVDPATGGVINDTALATFDGELPGDGTTTFGIDVRLEGVLPALGIPYEVTLYDDADDTVIAGPLEVSSDAAVDGVIVREQVEVRLPRALQATEELRVRAETSLPYGGESTHTTTVFVSPVEDETWQLTFDEPYGGDLIHALTARASEADDGTLSWTLQLGQGSEQDPLPIAHLNVTGHPGRQPSCGGDTGAFPFTGSVSTADYAYTVEQGTLDITRFDDVAFEASVSGDGERLDLNDPEAEIESVTLSGSIDWSGGGCTDLPDDPNEEELLGSYRASGDPFTCVALWAGNMAFTTAEELQQACGMTSDLICSEEDCTDMDRIARCDYRQEGAQELFAGTVYAHYQGTEASLAALEEGCVVQNGIYLPEE